MKTVCKCGRPKKYSSKMCWTCFIEGRRLNSRGRQPGYKYVKDNRKRNKERAVELLGGRCKLCGYNKTVNALEFHHVDRTKKSFTVSANMNKAWSKIVAELQNCVLLCANCHREVEAGLARI